MATTHGAPVEKVMQLFSGKPTRTAGRQAEERKRRGSRTGPTSAQDRTTPTTANEERAGNCDHQQMDDEARWTEAGANVFARRYRELDLTVGLVLGSERALVVDTRGDIAQGAELAAAVRALTPLPVTVAITHAHFDHCFGTAAFGSVPVLAHAGCASAIAATADAQRAEWVAHYRANGDTTTAEALATSVPVLPVTAPATLDLGDRRVALRHLGRGHTDHDLVVHVADAGVVFAGDLVEQGAPPDLADADLAAWPETLTALLGLGAGTVVPGHGDPVDPQFVAEQRDLLAEVATLDAALRRGDLDVSDAERRSPYPHVRWGHMHPIGGMG